MRIEWFFIWTNLNPFTKGCFVPSLIEICPTVLENFFLISSIYFCYFVIISPWVGKGCHSQGVVLGMGSQCHSNAPFGVRLNGLWQLMSNSNLHDGFTNWWTWSGCSDWLEKGRRRVTGALKPYLPRADGTRYPWRLAHLGEGKLWFKTSAALRLNPPTLKYFRRQPRGKSRNRNL